MNPIKRNVWNFQKCSFGCMTDYTYGDNIYFKNMDDILNEHHHHFILNNIQDMYITSPLKFIDEIFELFPNLFVDEILKIDECRYPNCGSVIKSKCMEKYNQQMKQMFNARE